MSQVTWSDHGETLVAAGAVNDAEGRFRLFTWGQGGLGDERRTTYCAATTAAGVDALPSGDILVSSMAPCLGLTNTRGESIWTVPSPILDVRNQTDIMRLSGDGKVVDFGYSDTGTAVLRFDVRSLTLSNPSLNDGLTFAPSQEGLAIDGWRNGTSPRLNGRALPFEADGLTRSLAIASDDKHFFLGSSFYLSAFDETGAREWRQPSRNEVWAVNASKDGRAIVTASGDGAIHWHRADDGRELLALQVLPNKGDQAK
jgi:hypothetical protein